MQTFLPYADFKQSASCLDRKRLGKQRVEGYQILNTLLNKSSGWKNHPAVKMWEGHEGYLLNYTMVICKEWTNRGYKDSIIEKLSSISNLSESKPLWLGIEDFHKSHRSNLLRKDYAWYSQFGWSESVDLPYYWPSKEIK